MHEFLVSALAFIVLVGVMVIVHELGHFTVAKLCKVRVEAFAFGFGPRLFGFKYGETDYKVCLLPLGGFVKMAGENGGDITTLGPGEFVEPQPEDPGAFTSHPRWQRMLIGLAGPAANFLLALFLMFIYFGFINEVPSVEVKTTTVEWVSPNSPAADAGFQPGDVITSFDGVSNPGWEKVYEHAKLNVNQTVPVTVQRGIASYTLSFHVPIGARDDDFDITDAGILPQYLVGPIGVASVEPGTPADQAGLREGDQIAAVDGHTFHTVPTLLTYMQTGQGKPLDLVVLRNGATIHLAPTPAKLPNPAKDGAPAWMLGFTPVPTPMRDNPLPAGQAMTKSIGFCRDNSFLILEVLERLFEHKVAVSQLSGPVGIARMAGEAAEMKGWYPKFGLAGEISLNLGILNLLPFPILDGGMILLLLIESVIRRDISLNIKERIYQAAFVVLMAFFVFIIFNDVTKLPLFAHVKP